MTQTPRKHKILVVEDTKTQRELVRATLDGAGFDVHAAETGAEALRLANEQRPDVVVLDVMLPDGSGYEICSELKTSPATQDTVVLLLSSLGTDSKQRTQGLDYGADAYLRKPVKPDELVAHVNSLLRICYAEKRAGAAEAARGRLAAVLELCEDAVVVTDVEGKVVVWNPAAVQLFGHTAEEMCGAALSSLYPKDQAEEQRTLWSRALAGELLRGHESPRLGKSGIVRVRLNLCAVRDQAGKATGVAETARLLPSR